GGTLDPRPCARGNGARRRGAVQDRRNGAGRQADMFRDFPQGDSSRLAEARLLLFSHVGRLSQTTHHTSAFKLAYRTKQSNSVVPSEARDPYSPENMSQQWAPSLRSG